MLSIFKWYLMIVSIIIMGRADCQYFIHNKNIHVIVIGVDGLSTIAMQNSNIPTLDSLISNGAYIPNAHTVLPSSSSPNWASMIMGAGPELHGVTDNDWELDDHSLEAMSVDEHGRFPTIFDILRQGDPKIDIASIYEWDGFGRLYNIKMVNYDKNGKDAYETEVLASKYILQHQPQFTFIHFDLVDHAGHTFGHGTPSYFASVHVVDSLIGNICRVVKNAGMVSNTIIMIVADHGGVGLGHGGNSEQEVRVPMIISGKGIKKGYVVQQQVLNYDVAPTIAYAFKVTPPYIWTGRPIKSAFVGNSEPQNLWLGTIKVEAPLIYPIASLNSDAGGLYIDTPAIVKLTASKGHAIYYTLDGSEPNKTSHLYKQAFVLDTTTVVKAITLDKKNQPSKVQTAYFRILHKTNRDGILTHYYTGQDWKQVPDFSKLNAIDVDTLYEFRLGDDNQIKKLLNEHTTFGAKLESKIDIPEDGVYTFYTKSDDGSLLYIDEKLIVNNDGNHGVVEKMGSVSLEKGMHVIRVDYINNGGGYWLQVYYNGNGIAKQIIPANILHLN